MSKKNRFTRSAIFAGLVAAWGASGAALAVDEVEPNNVSTSAQHLVIGSDGTAQVDAIMGVLSGEPVRDIDFYSFEGKEGDVVTVDIDGGLHADGTGVDTIVAIFAPDNSILLQKDDADSLDPGSDSTADSRLDNVRLPVTGTYIIGVSSYPGDFVDINNLSTGMMLSNANGAYTLIVSGVSAPEVTPPPDVPPPPPPEVPPQQTLQPINILVKPDTIRVSSGYHKHKANERIPVALLSSKDFDPMQVDQATLRFGVQGSEESLVHCHSRGRDYNGDRRPDLVCLFDAAVAGFDVGDTEGVLTGETTNGTQFEGRGWLKVIRAGKRPFQWRHRWPHTNTYFYRHTHR